MTDDKCDYCMEPINWLIKAVASAKTAYVCMDHFRLVCYRWRDEGVLTLTWMSS